MKLDYICEDCLLALEILCCANFQTGAAPVCPRKKCACGANAHLIIDRDQHQVPGQPAGALVEVIHVFKGSDGDATKALYARLETLGPVGHIAENLFRALKSSSRAKVYRGGGYRGMAYDRKEWAMGNLASLLDRYAEACALPWGWGEDQAQGFHKWVLYIDLPTGQVSFHAAARGHGPDYPGAWDGVVNAGAGRMCRWVAQLLEKEPVHG